MLANFTNLLMKEKIYIFMKYIKFCRKWNEKIRNLFKNQLICTIISLLSFVFQIILFPLSNLRFLLFQILVPILSNDKNHEKWPRVVSADIIQQVHNLKRNVDVVLGQVKGKTLLPLPVGIENIEHLDIK